MQTQQMQLFSRCIKLMILPVFLVMISGGCEYILPNKPPYVNVIFPADSASFNIGEVVKFQVNAYDIDGSIRHVVFTAPNSAATIDTLAPYEYSWRTEGLTQGYYPVEISAIDNKDEPYTLTMMIRLIGNLNPSAGADATFNDSRTSYVLQAEAPTFGQGTWSIMSGTGGALSDIHDPHATLTGLPCQTYLLYWTVNNGTRQFNDEVTIKFFYLPSQAFAGNNQVITDGSISATLHASNPADGSGRWSVLSGGTGSFNNSSIPNAVFTGQTCTTYSLIWSVSTPCAISSDTLEIRFDPFLINPDAGPDQSFTDGRIATVLAANNPASGNGTWSVVSGQNGQFTSVNDPHTMFAGQLCQSYVLRWTLSTPCSSKSDEMTVSFGDVPSISNAGTDQNLSNGSLTAQLNAVPPVNGSGFWSIVSGGGGSFSDPTDPYSVFTGILCHSYVLRWTVSTACSSSFDEVTIVLNQVAVNAYAGPDVRVSDGSLTTLLQANTPPDGTTGSWSIVSGQGGILEDVNSPISRLTGITGQIYTLKWSITNACMENSDRVTISFISNITMIDPRDEKVYRAVRVGYQIWMAENLNYSAEGSFSYGNSGENASVYGRLYDWNTANTVCPAGWHLPTDLDWRQLEVFMGMDAATSLLEWYRGNNEGGMLKEEGTLYWESPNAGASNLSGFSARPGGYRTPSGIFGGLNTHAGFWTASANSSGNAIYRTLHKDKTQVGRDYYEKGYAFSVRCLKN